MRITTDSLELVLQTPDELRAMIEGMSDADRAELSEAWLSQVRSATESDPWVHGFTMTLRDGGVPVGSCGFKGPPTADGVVEIAYGVAPEHQGKGYATEAAAALLGFAFSAEEVGRVRAHTLPEANASTRVLTKYGFTKLGEVVDPDDGLVWRRERGRAASPDGEAR